MSAIDDVRIAIATFGERIEHVMDRAGSLHALSTAILELDERLKRVEAVLPDRLAVLPKTAPIQPQLVPPSSPESLNKS